MATDPNSTDPNFWPDYLEQHRDPANRALHVAGTLSAAALLGVGLARRDWRALVAAPLVGYGAAWLGHFLVERNRPKTLDAPLASLAADIRMAGLALTGQLAREYRRYGIPDRPGLVIRRHPPSAPALEPVRSEERPG
ncbi:Mpo1-like protein [Azospirillum argentinense]